MRFKSITIRNFRALEYEELKFNPVFNLIVGINGIGKSSILDTLRISASRILPLITESRMRKISFSKSDIKLGLPFLDLDLHFENNGSDFRYHRLEWREGTAKDNPENVRKLRRSILEGIRLRDRARNLLRKLDDTLPLEDRDDIFPSDADLGKSASPDRSPNCIYFGTTRSFPSDSMVSKNKAIGGKSAAYADALGARQLLFAQFADWINVQAELAKEMPQAEGHLNALLAAVKVFLPEYKNLRADLENGPRLVIDKGESTFDIRQLSDGERGVLTLVLDLARRLSQANPRLKNPIREGSAIVLIDELDLHLHPKWQRTIVERLTATFPRCQFIATTHSPQIVAAVEPEQVLLLTADGAMRPDRTLGMDSNWILRHLMETDERPAAVAKAIRKIQALISEGDFAKARKRIAAGRQHWPDLPDWAVLETRILRMEALAK